MSAPIRHALTEIVYQLEAHAAASEPVSPDAAGELATTLRHLASALWEPSEPPVPTPQALRFWACRLVGWSVFMGRGASPDPEDVRTAASALFGAARGMERVAALKVVG